MLLCGKVWLNFIIKPTGFTVKHKKRGACDDITNMVVYRAARSRGGLQHPANNNNKTLPQFSLSVSRPLNKRLIVPRKGI